MRAVQGVGCALCTSPVGPSRPPIVIVAVTAFVAATQVSGFTIDIATATIPAGVVSNVTFTGNPRTVAMQSGVSLSNSVTYVAYAAVTETGGEWSSTVRQAWRGTCGHRPDR